jgi:hypothetical protein
MLLGNGLLELKHLSFKALCIIIAKRWSAAWEGRGIQLLFI